MVKVGEYKKACNGKFCLDASDDGEVLYFVDESGLACWTRKGIQEIVAELVEWLAETAPKEASPK
jgi:hypothetical protein